MEQGGPHFSVLPQICPGKTGRAWKFKQSLLRRRRSRRRHRQAALSLSRRTFLHVLYLHVLHLAGLNMCPGFSHRTCAVLQLIVSKAVQICCMAQQQHRHRVVSPCTVMSESDEDAPWRLGPPPPLASGAADGPRPPAGPPPPRAVDSWSRLSHAYSQAVAGVINTHYATHFRGTILTYLPAELQTPFVGLQDLVVSIRPLRPHERNHPLRLHIQDDEADTVEGTETMGHHEAGTDEHPSHSAGDDIDEPAYYYADTMMPISEGEDEGPDDTAASTTAATASTRAPSSKAKAKAKAGRKPPARADGNLFRPQFLSVSLMPPPPPSSVCIGGKLRTSRCTEAGLQVALLIIDFLAAAWTHLLVYARRSSTKPAAVPDSLWCTSFWCHRPRLRRAAQTWKTALLVQGICILIISWIQCNSWHRYNADSSPFLAGSLPDQTLYNANWPYRPLAGLWSLFNLLLFYAGPVSQHFFYNSGTARQAVHTAKNLSTSTWRSTSTYSRVGPKSGHSSGRHVCQLLFVLLLFTYMPIVESGAVDARVDAGATTATEITEHVSVVKPSGMRRASAPLTRETPRHVKRSYLRASARALRNGGAWYKGSWREAKWFEAGAIRTQGIGKRPSFKPEPRAWHVVTWNASGLTVSTFQELETLLRRDKVDIAFIQESKWKFESTWANDDYLYVHTCGTGPLDRVGGLLTVVSTKLAKASDLQYQVLHAGRLLHVRFPCGSFHADLLNCYQYAVGQDEQVYERRHKWFIKLHKCLTGLPRRNILVMGGDLNTPCIPHKGVCGPMVTTHAATQYKDYQDLQNILRTLNLTVLNTWCRPVHGQIATFSTFGGERASQIDFLIVRSRHATREAKQAQALPDFPVAAWREGHKHYPVQAWISKLGPPWHQAGVVQQHAHKIDTETIIHDLKQQQEPVQLRALRDEVRQHLTDDPTKLSQVLLQAAQTHYPVKRPEVRPQSQPEALANCAKNMWALFRRMRSQPFRLAGIFQAWRCWADFQRAHALHMNRSRQRSKQRKLDILDSAQQAANEGNAYKVWQAVKKLVPKVPRKQLQLHKHGTMMTFREELDWIVEAYGRRYGEQAQVDELPVCTVDKTQKTFSISSADLEAQLAKLNPRKAVPKGTTPSVVWKACSQIVAGPVTEAFNFLWQEETPTVAQSWADAEVALLPKSHGRSATPEDWRPIGLQDPLGKCVMGLVVAQARRAIVHMVMRYPQCAYLPGRSTSTALKQVFRHCFAVRRECERTRVNIHQRHQGQRTAQCIGGLQISLDLSAAFDVVQWSHLKTALDQAGVCLLVQEVILTWLTQVRYLFNHRGHQGIVKPKWGLRQGCKASPCLWAAYTALLCATLDHELSGKCPAPTDDFNNSWTRQHITKYADDTHARWMFSTYSEFEAVMQEINIVLQCFRRFHMRINLEKTKAILKVVGSLKHRVKQNFVRKFQDSRRLLLSPKNPDKWLTLVSHAEYLGAVVSYDQYELQTMRHRIQKANNRRWALASFLHSRRISVSLKLRIWRSCVLTTLMYGLSSCGI